MSHDAIDRYTVNRASGYPLARFLVSAEGFAAMRHGDVLQVFEDVLLVKEQGGGLEIVKVPAVKAAASDTYETWIDLPNYPAAVVHSARSLSAGEVFCDAPPGVTISYRTERHAGRLFLVIAASGNEQQLQSAAPETVQEQAHDDIPLDFDLTEASFAGLPPRVDAGKEEWEKIHIGSLGLDAERFGVVVVPRYEDRPVIPAEPEGAPIAGTAEQACAVLADGPVESWAAEAEAKRWRGDMVHILSHCNICGAASVHSEPHCAACRKEDGPFTAFWRALGGAMGEGVLEPWEEALEAWDAAARRRTWPGSRQPQPVA